MKTRHLSFLYCTLATLFLNCSSNGQKTSGQQAADTITKNNQVTVLPAPYATSAVRNMSKVVDWPAGQTPVAPAGFVVEKYADGLESPRWIYQAPNGDIFVAEANTGTSVNRISLFRDVNNDGKPDMHEVFQTGLDRPFGMLVLNNYFYIACTDGLWRYPYQAGQTKITDKGQKLLNLPAGGYNNHWTRNIVANADGSKIYVTVGSGSNNGEHGIENEQRRANILEINPDGTGERVYAYGMRNPVGMSWEPVTHTLWTAVNERDNLGDDLVPDYLTSVKEGGFYGWPYSYFGKHPDPRMKDDPHTELVNKAIVPDVSLGAHTASLGLAFYDKTAFPIKYQGGAFIGQHGSWNRSELVGYKVVFVPFHNGKPAGAPEDFLTGFIADKEKSKVYGRPVGVTVLKDGSMLVADDGSEVIWRVRAK